MAINLYEDFDNGLGTFQDYDNYDSAQRDQIKGQRHIDIRTFDSGLLAPYAMSTLDRFNETQLDLLSQQALETGNVLRAGENWTAAGTPLGQNLILNPSFEYDSVGSAPAGWSYSGFNNSVFAVQTGWAKQGTRSLRCRSVFASLGVNGGLITPSHSIPVDATQSYTVSASINILALSGQGITLSVSYVNSSFASVASRFVTPVTSLGQANLSLTIEPISTAVSATVFIGSIFGVPIASTQDFYVDAIQFSVTTPDTSFYFDGDSPGASWIGTPGDSVSQVNTVVATGPQADRNNFAGLSMLCFPGTNTATSVITTSDGIQTLDLGGSRLDTVASLPLLFGGDGDSISLALPTFPATSIDLSDSYIDFTSESSGDFATGPTASIPFSATGIPLSFPSTRVLDSFSRSGDVALSASPNWIANWAGQNLRSNGVAAYSPFGLNQIVGNDWLTPYSLPVETYIDIPSGLSSNAECQLEWIDDPTVAPVFQRGYFVFVTSSVWQIVRRDIGSITTLANGVPPTILPGDALAMSIATTGVITAWHRTAGVWSALGTATDTTYTGSRHIGFQTNDPSVRFTNFGGGTTQTDFEARFATGYLAGIDRSRITGVRLRIHALQHCTFRCLGIRALGNTWTFAPVDQNTLYDRLQATIPPSGSITQPYTFPIAASGAPTDWPILWRSDPLSSDPTPVDMELGAHIHTGAGAGLNRLTLYFRETPTVPDLQSDLDGQTMAALEAIGTQPDDAPPGADFTPDTMSDLDALRMGTLDTDTMHVLEAAHRVPDTRYMYVTVQWGSAGSVQITDQTGLIDYTFSNVGIGSQADYYLFCKLEDNSVRVRVLPLSPEGYIRWGLPVFDSTTIIDRALLIRRKGRFGWYAHLQDGDTYVTALRDRYTIYNEYRSLPFNSETPVEGAQLYTAATPDDDLYQGAVPNNAGTRLTLDLTKSNSGKGLRVDCDGSTGQQGLRTSLMRFTNLIESRIEFDALIPTGASLTALLSGESRAITLNVPPLAPSQWQHVVIPLDTVGRVTQPGRYQVTLTQTEVAETTWYVDNLSIPTAEVVWEGRQAADPWRMRDPDWVPFGTTVNQATDGIIFERGTQMQIRGRGITSTGTVQHLQLVPKYAELGNFSWPDQQPSSLGLPSPSFTIAKTALSVTFTSTSTAPNGIAAQRWNFGDGAIGYGAHVTHVYTGPGAYVVTLTVIDQIDLKASTTQTVTVTAGILTLPLVFTK